MVTFHILPPNCPFVWLMGGPFSFPQQGRCTHTASCFVVCPLLLLLLPPRLRQSQMETSERSLSATGLRASRSRPALLKQGRSPLLSFSPYTNLSLKPLMRRATQDTDVRLSVNTLQPERGSAAFFFFATSSHLCLSSPLTR